MSLLKLKSHFSLDLQLQPDGEGYGFWERYNLFLVIAVATDLITPMLIALRVLPGAVRYLSDITVAIMLAFAFTRMLVFNRIPRILFWFLGLSTIGILVGLFEGQGGAATMWGWWRMYRYPMIGLFAYLQPVWPEKLAPRLIKSAVIVLAIEVGVQLWQYFIMGEIAGDNLSGTFGKHGVGPLLLFLMFVLCLTYGDWIANNNWKSLLIIIVLGGVSSGLAAQKLFPFAVIIVGIVAASMQMVRSGKVQLLVVYVAAFFVIAIGFSNFYNRVVADERDTKRIEEFVNINTLDEYLNSSGSRGDGNYNLGRSFALQLGWENIQRDVTTLLFGMGIGSRSSSVTLGLVGAGLQEGYYGLTSGTSLLVIMQETGLFGLTFFMVFIAVVVIQLTIHIWRDPYHEATGLRFGIILFSIFWPLWIWYHQAWNFSVMMLLYWISVAYLLAHPVKDKREPEPFRPFVNPAEEGV
jgi:hypothetical protein